MERELTTRLPISITALRVEASARTISSLAVPLVANLFQVYGLTWFFCHTPPGAILTWLTLLRTATVLLVITGVAHVFALWINRRLFSALNEEPYQSLLFAIWPTIVWMPLFVLLEKMNSPAIALLPVTFVASTITSLKRWSSSTISTPPTDAGSISTLFHVQKSPAFLRLLAPAFAASIALQGAIAELAVDQFLMAGSMFAAGLILPLWVYPRKPKPFAFDGPAWAASPTRASLHAAIPRSATAFLLLVIALIPFLRPGPISSGFRAFFHLRQAYTSMPPAKHDVSHPPNDYSGVILLLPPKPRHQIEPPPPPTPPDQFSANVKKPVVIPFDGAYWYFRAPDPRPRPDARVVHGDPTKAVIRSTDFRALAMEAHQHLGKVIQMDCCSAIRVALQNADDRPGTIAIEVQLQRTDPKGFVTTQSLGLLPIHSSEAPSIPLNRPPVDESLNFPFPPNRRGKQFDEIIIIVHPARERSRAGAHIAIQNFTLVP